MNTAIGKQLDTLTLAVLALIESPDPQIRREVLGELKAMARAVAARKAEYERRRSQAEPPQSESNS